MGPARHGADRVPPWEEPLPVEESPPSVPAPSSHFGGEVAATIERALPSAGLTG